MFLLILKYKQAKEDKLIIEMGEIKVKSKIIF